MREFNHEPAAVAKARTAADMTMNQLAQQVGCSRSLISEIEGGTRNARPELLQRIADALDCPVADLEHDPAVTS